MNKAIVLRKKTLLKELQNELDEDIKMIIKTKAKNKLKQIRMAEITLRNLKKELEDIMNGRKTYTEEELLFNE